MAGAAADLAKAFGFTFYDGFARYRFGRDIIDFSEKNELLDLGPLVNDPILNEMGQVRTFTGQGFDIPDDAHSILNLSDKMEVHLTDTMWVFNDTNEVIPGEGLSQGAIMEYGNGRLAFFGEAAMFTAQLSGKSKRKAGMNTPKAKDNYKLLLAIIHWLDD